MTKVRAEVFMLYVDWASSIGTLGLCVALLAACANPEVPPAQTAVCPAADKCPAGTQCTPIAAPAQPVAAEPPRNAKSVQPRYYEMKGSLVRELHADLTGKDYELLIGLPPSFEKEPDRRYPTLYVLDGQWDYKLLDSIAGGLRYDEVMPEMVIVGLSYGGSKPDYDALRADDYVPTHAKDFQGNEKGGGASRFLSWLETVVLPLVEHDYRGDSAHRILSGSSFGGLFALYALFEKPELFESYVSMSPAVGWDNGYIFKREREFRKTHPTLDRRLWLSVGSEEWPDLRKGALEFFKQVKNSKYASLALKVQTIEGERHAGNKPEAYNRAMRFVSEPLMPKKALAH
jgi:uncharacterized protein